MMAGMSTEPTPAPAPPGSPDAPALPSVSVVVPVLDEERHLADAVAMVLGQDYAGPLEVVLALGPSSDGTDAVAERLAAQDERVRLVRNPSGRTPDALNAAVGAAVGEVVVRVDGHAEIPPGYVATAVAALEATGADTVGGTMHAEGRTPFERAVAAAMRSPLGVGSSRFHTGGGAGPVDTVYLGVFRRTALDRVGGYDRRFTRTQDWELNHRIRSTGGTVWFTPDLVVTYRPRSRLRRPGPPVPRLRSVAAGRRAHPRRHAQPPLPRPADDGRRHDGGHAARAGLAPGAGGAGRLRRRRRRGRRGHHRG